MSQARNLRPSHHFSGVLGGGRDGGDGRSCWEEVRGIFDGQGLLKPVDDGRRHGTVATEDVGYEPPLPHLAAMLPSDESEEPTEQLAREQQMGLDDDGCLRRMRDIRDDRFHARIGHGHECGQNTTDGRTSDSLSHEPVHLSGRLRVLTAAADQ